jgi:membrane-associated phospholipid phosphatase
MSLKPSPISSERRALPGRALRRRLGWLVALFLVQWLYFPINRLARGGVVLATPWDALIPLWPVWVIPYLFSLLWWAGCFVWAALQMDEAPYQTFIVSLIAVMLASYVVYLAYPTYVLRPTPQGNDLLTRAIRLLYRSDRVHNAFPSGHTYNTVLITLFWWRWLPRQRWLWVSIAVIILLSTLFTRQHNLPDLAGGMVFAWLGYRFGLWWVARPSKARCTMRKGD